MGAKPKDPEEVDRAAAATGNFYDEFSPSFLATTALSPRTKQTCTMSSYMSLAVSPAPEVTMASTGHRVPAIDVLRGLCIIAVVLHHINLRIPFKNSAFGGLLSPAINRVLFWDGAYGVTVFFVISGFLITTWSLKRWGAPAQINMRQFYRMRFARIMPCLLALLGLLAVLHLTGRYGFVINPQRTTLPRALLAALTFHVNWLESTRGYLPGAWDVLWSLSVEEMFYVFFPILCRTTRNLTAFIAVLSGFVIIGPFARTILTHNSLWQDYGYLACMDGIALGCIAAVVVRTITVHAINARKIILRPCAGRLAAQRSRARYLYYCFQADYLDVGSAEGGAQRHGT